MENMLTWVYCLVCLYVTDCDYKVGVKSNEEWERKILFLFGNAGFHGQMTRRMSTSSLCSKMEGHDSGTFAGFLVEDVDWVVDESLLTWVHDGVTET